MGKDIMTEKVLNETKKTTLASKKISGLISFKMLMILKLLLMCVQIAKSSSIQCPNTVTISNPEYLIYTTFNTTDTTFSHIKATLGPSGATYYASASGTQTVVFSKEDTTGNIVWSKSYNPLKIFQKGFMISWDEETLYAMSDLSTTSIAIYKISPSTGELVKKYEETNHRSYASSRTMWSKFQLSPDNTVMFYTAVTSAHKGVLCKFTVTGTTSDCFEAGNLQDLTTLLYVNSTHLFITARDISTYRPIIAMVEWGQTTPAWQNRRGCYPANNCKVRLGSAMLSADKTKIYSFFAQNSNRYLTFAIYNVDTGVIVGQRYTSNSNGIQGCWDVQLHGDILYCLVYQNSYAELYTYNLASDTWLDYFRTDSPFGSLLENSQRDVIIVYGQKNNKAYKIGFYRENATTHESVSASTYNMVVASEAYAEEVGGSWITFGSIYNVAMTEYDSSNATETISDVQFIFDNTNSWETNIFENTTAAIVNFTSEDKISIDPNCTCTTTPERTDVTYAIESNNGETIPDWIELNMTSKKYEGTAPNVTSTTNYTLILKSTWTTKPAGSSQQIVTFTIAPKPVANATEPEEEPIVLSSAVAAVTAGSGGGIAAAVANSIANVSPPTAVYFILHQLQLIILFLMIDPYIPNSMKAYLEGQSLALVNFNFIPTTELPGIDIPVGWMHGEQANEILVTLGIESKSTFVNNMSLFIFIFSLVILHLLLRFVLICGSRDPETRNRFFKFWNWLRLKILDIIKYALYMRLLIESHEALMLSSCSEIYEWELNTFSSYVSMVGAIFILIVSLLLPFLSFYAFWRYRHHFDPDKKFILMEFLSDLRNAKVARIYMTLMLVRRIIFVCVVIFLIEIPREFIYSILIITQFAYMVILAIIRPFDNVINNILEFINEVFLFIVICILLSYDKESKWTDAAESRLLTVLMINGYLILAVMVVGFIIAMIQKCCIKKKDRKDQYQQSNCSEENDTDEQCKPNEHTLKTNQQCHEEEKVAEINTENYTMKFKLGISERCKSGNEKME
ncbi:unnamed protein product [Moneuplotes crassus]|uniref:Uncharacterized protein n=1 Tax=Euplotes crassus TaxID=5936 RepID=A0AAD1UR36_EUPCR|nr:unnamed protein product [Moneuplotes crassus]